MGTEADDFDDVLNRARSGDETAFLRLWDHLQPQLLRYLRVLGCDEADDVASETWLQAVRDLSRFNGGADDFRGWLFGIGRHRAIDASLGGLARALTADGTVGELAGRPAALAMFRDSRRRPRRRWFAVSLSSAAAAVVLAGGIAAAYAAVLPGPVQHIAYRMLGSIGVPDTPRSASSPGPSSSGARSSGAPHLAATIPPARPTSGAGGCPCPTGSPGTAAAAPDVTLAATLTRIPANAGDVFTGRLTVRGRPEAGARVQLSERAGNGASWQSAGSAVTDRGGQVTLTVVHLTSNASFRLAAPGGAVSRPVLITVVPPVYVDLVPGRLAGVDRVTVWAPFAQAGDTVVLQELSGGAWHRVSARVLGQYHLASFAVLVPLSGHVEYQVVLPATTAHGWSASHRVRVAAEPGLSSAAVASTE